VATILIADDEEPLRELLGAVLEQAGHRTLLAIHGGRALELAKAERPDLVISDVMMPRMGGVELCRRLKAGDGTRAIPVILMSSAGEQVARGVAFDAFLAKPFHLDELERLVTLTLAGLRPHA
jgi:CheY-like chemotaxis protein